MGNSTNNSASERLEAVYRSDYPKLWASLLGSTGDHSIANEATAEAFAQALNRGEELQDPAAWVWRSAFRIAAGLLAERGGSVVLVDRLPEQPVTDPQTAELLSLLQRLSPQQRSAMALRYLLRCSAEEIGEILNTSAGTVRVQLHRAHRILRKQMETDRNLEAGK